LGFLVEPQNQVLKTSGTVSPGLTSKPVVTVSSDLVSKSVAQVSQFGPQNRQLRFGDLDLKLPRWFLGLGHKTMRDRVCRLRHRIDG
jgi:hypothetical protein